MTRPESGWPRFGAIATAWIGLLGGGIELRGATLTTDLTAIDHSTYAGVSSHFSLANAAVDGATLWDGNAYMFCVDLIGDSIDQDLSGYPAYVDTLDVGLIADVEVWNRFDTPQDQDLAIAQAYWLVDNQFEDYFLAPGPDQDARQYAFQNVIWEIFGDGGTAAGLSFSSGNIDRSKFGPGGSSASPVLWGHMNDLLSAVSNAGITGGYVPTYHFGIALDARPEYQDYLLLAADPALMVPEPGLPMLLLLSGLALGKRRR